MSTKNILELVLIVSIAALGCGEITPVSDDAGSAGTVGSIAGVTGTADAAGTAGATSSTAGVAGTTDVVGQAGMAAAGALGTAGTTAAAGAGGTAGKEPSPTDAPAAPPGWSGTWPPVGWTYGQPLPGYDQRAQGYVLKPGYGQQTDPAAPSCVGKKDYDPCTTPRQIGQDGAISIGPGVDVPGRCFLGVCCFGCITNNGVCRQIPKDEPSHWESPGVENLCGANADACIDCNTGGAMRACEQSILSSTGKPSPHAMCLN